MTTLESVIGARVRTGRKILSVFVTAGLPSLQGFPGLVASLAASGADLVEIGVPFSDPIADGPVIQASSRLALSMGVTPASVLGMVREIRKITDVPVILMGYANPFLSYGLEKFTRDAASAGAGGMIVPDLPPEESATYRAAAAASGLAAVFLVSPTTPDVRIAEIDKISSGFVYAVSTLGVTGARDRVSGGSLAFLARARKSVRRNPLLAGFGISGPDSARELAGQCDGVIVGSAVVSRLCEAETGEGIQAASEFTASLRASLDA